MSNQAENKGRSQKLFSQIQQGNKEAFTKAYEKYSKMLYGLAYQYLKSNEMAEDAVQQTFTKLWEHHKQIVITTSLRNYLYTMTRNHILNQIRDRKAEIINNYQIVQKTEKYQLDITHLLEKEETMNVFYKAIALLPKRKREICMLKMEEQMSNEKIADTLQISVSTVKTHYTQSKKLLRNFIKKMSILITFVVLL